MGNFAIGTNFLINRKTMYYKLEKLLKHSHLNIFAIDQMISVTVR
jgi:hypothetical protein